MADLHADTRGRLARVQLHDLCQAEAVRRGGTGVLGSASQAQRLEICTP